MKSLYRRLHVTALFCLCLLSAQAASGSSSLTPEFLDVLRGGDVAGLRNALDQGAAVNARDAAGNTPLIFAAAYGSTACLRLLLDRGAEINATNTAGATALMRAAVGATALAVQALQRYSLPGRKLEFAKQVNRARQWLWTAKPQHNDGRIYQLLGLAWAGEPARKLQPLAKTLLAEQHSDGGWSQLPGIPSDAYATGQAVYALRVGAGLPGDHPAVDRGLRYLLSDQLEDGTWHVRRRAFPFQPTMNSGFPHGRDSWISAAGTSWAVMALSLPEQSATIALSK